MRLTTFFMAVVFMQVQAEGLSQPRITLSKNNISLKAVLKDIRRQTGYNFLIRNQVLSIAHPVSINVAGASVEATLNQCLKDQPLTYDIVDKTVIIRLNDQPDQQQAPPPVVEIRGRVTDEKGAALAGVTVTLKNSGIGTVTDANGNYALQLQENEGTLVFSFIGFMKKEVSIAGQSEINVKLEATISALNQVVVVGYGTQKKADLTEAISSVSEKELQSRPVPTFQDALQGRASGVQISQTGGNLDGRFAINIRGAGTVTSSNQPLVVVDGVPLASGVELSTINPQDIASVDILKDASATAIYGARASNGVIIISTRRGTAGKTKLTFNMDMGFEQISKMYKVLTSEQQRQLFVEAFKNTNRSTAAFDNPDDSIWHINHNWQKLATRTAFRQGYYIGVSGGNDNNRFSVSGGFKKRQGVMRNSDITDYYFRANNDMTVGKKLKISSAVTASYQTQHTLPNDIFNGGGTYETLVDAHSYNPVYDEQGNLTATSTSADPFFGSNVNPLINILMPTRISRSTRLLGNIKADYAITQELTLSGNVGTDIVAGSDYTYLPVFQAGIFGRPQGSTTNSSALGLNWVADLTLIYQRTFGVHAVKVLAGYSAQQFRDINSGATGTGTIDNSLNQLSNQTTFNASGSDVSSGLLSSFARVNYGYDERYLVTATIRRDGSSKFGPEKQYGIFPSASVAWRISHEDFFKSTLINDLKLRVGYGLTGNQNIPDFAFITRAGANRYAFGNSIAVGNAALNVGNPTLQWESAKQLDAGIDISLLEGRITSTIDYYDKRSDNLLIQVPLPNTAGVTENPTVNLGSVENKGMEFLISSTNITGRFKWVTDFNITYNKNKVLNIGTNSAGDPLQVQGTTLALPQDFANLTVAGRPIGTFYMYKFAGIWQLGEEDEAAKAGAVPGDPRYVDRNGNGLLDEGDKYFVGSPQPVYFGGLNNTFSYGSFSLSVFLNFSGGNKLYNAMRNLNARAVPYNQQLAEVADFWTPQNPSNKVPRPSQGGNTTFLATRISTKFLEDASYLRLKNLSLSYNIPPGYLQRLKLEGASITFAATNLLTFTKYSGLDPESASQGGLTSGGLDFTPYPPTRYYYLSLSVTF